MVMKVYQKMIKKEWIGLVRAVIAKSFKWIKVIPAGTVVDEKKVFYLRKSCKVKQVWKKTGDLKSVT
jgi:RNase P/RNase MRP subunit p29